MEHQEDIIVTNNLTKRYGRRLGVDSLNLEVPEGALFGFLGPNGAGKTTTIRVLLGLLRASQGGARVLGLDCWKHASTIKEEVGYLPGDLRLYSWMTGENALRIFSGVRRRDLTGPGRELAERFDLHMQVRVRSMSRGMRQKLGLILALAHQPRLLILDEPTASLDPLMQDRLYQHLRELASRGHTVFFSSHTLSEVEQLCDRVAILREGRLVTCDTLENLSARARREVTLRWRQDTKLDELKTPGCLTIDMRNGYEWRGTLTGEVSDLIQWLSRMPVEDLTIGRPDLESLFRDYYEKSKE